MFGNSLLKQKSLFAALLSPNGSFSLIRNLIDKYRIKNTDNLFLGNTGIVE